jgi:outer membrane protein insertion porin family
VNSGPLVDVVVNGIELKKVKLRESLPMLRQGGTDDFTIEEGRRRLLELVQREGYFFATIETHIERGEIVTIRLDMK